MTDSYKKPRNGNDKRYDGNRKPYHSTQIPNPQFINPQYRSTDNKTPYKERRKGGSRKYNEGDNIAGQLGKLIPGVNTLLEKIAENQSALIDAAERISAAEAQKAEAMTDIAKSIKTFLERESAMTAAQAKMADASRPASAQYGPNSADKSPVSEKDRVIEMIIGFRKKGMSYRKIAQRLEEANIKTFSGKGRWHSQTVQKIGKFHFPDAPESNPTLVAENAS